MGFPIGRALNVATRALQIIAFAVPAVEAAQRFKTSSDNQEKRAAVLDLVRAELEAAELVAGRDLANDRDVIAAAGTVNDAVVALHKVLARKIDGGA